MAGHGGTRLSSSYAETITGQAGVGLMRDRISKRTNAKGTDRLTEEVQCVPSKPKALSSNPSYHLPTMNTLSDN
jgi:hypothetical protein